MGPLQSQWKTVYAGGCRTARGEERQMYVQRRQGAWAERGVIFAFGDEDKTGARGRGSWRAGDEALLRKGGERRRVLLTEGCRAEELCEISDGARYIPARHGSAECTLFDFSTLLSSPRLSVKSACASRSRASSAWRRCCGKRASGTFEIRGRSKPMYDVKPRRQTDLRQTPSSKRQSRCFGTLPISTQRPIRWPSACRRERQNTWRGRRRRSRRGTDRRRSALRATRRGRWRRRRGCR